MPRSILLYFETTNDQATTQKAPSAFHLAGRFDPREEIVRGDVGVEVRAQPRFRPRPRPRCCHGRLAHAAFGAGRERVERRPAAAAAAAAKALLRLHAFIRARVGLGVMLAAGLEHRQ